jgi:flagellar biosynthesis chaperone FliJ
MAQPVFSLQAVLDVRHSRVEALEITLGKLLAEERAGRERQDLLRAQQTELMQRMVNAMHADELDIVQVDLLRRNLLASEIESARVQTILNELARMVVLKRNELLKAHQDEEVLETLKEQRNEVFRNEQKAKEASQQSDVYIAQAFRQRKATMSGR